MQVIFDQILVSGHDAKIVCKGTCNYALIDFAQVKVISGFAVDNSRADLAIDRLIIKLEIISFQYGITKRFDIGSIAVAPRISVFEFLGAKGLFNDITDGDAFKFWVYEHVRGYSDEHKNAACVA